MCSLCYNTDHTRSKCTHLGSSRRFCSNCRDPSHLAKQCLRLSNVCAAAGSHNLLKCERYRLLTLLASRSSYPLLSPFRHQWSHHHGHRMLVHPIVTTTVHLTRHVSIDSDSIASHNSRDNKSPLFLLCNDIWIGHLHEPPHRDQHHHVRPLNHQQPHHHQWHTSNN